METCRLHGRDSTIDLWEVVVNNYCVCNIWKTLSNWSTIKLDYFSSFFMPTTFLSFYMAYNLYLVVRSSFLSVCRLLSLLNPFLLPLLVSFSLNINLYLEGALFSNISISPPPEWRLWMAVTWAWTCPPGRWLACQSLNVLCSFNLSPF